MEWVSVGVDANQKAPDVPDVPGSSMLEHCPYCALHATAFAPPPSSMDGQALLQLAFDVPRLFLSAPRTLYAWLTSQPRGPPSLS